MKAFAGLLIKTTTQQTLPFQARLIMALKRNETKPFITGFSAFKMLNLCTSHLYPRPQIEGIPVYWQKQKGIMTFHFSEPWYKPCPVGTSLWLQPCSCLSPTLHKRKSHRGKGPIVKPLAIPWHCRDNKKVMALHLSLAILVGGGGGGRGCK